MAWPLGLRVALATPIRVTWSAPLPTRSKATSPVRVSGVPVKPSTIPVPAIRRNWPFGSTMVRVVTAPLRSTKVTVSLTATARVLTWRLSRLTSTVTGRPASAMVPRNSPA